MNIAAEDHVPILPGAHDAVARNSEGAAGNSGSISTYILPGRKRYPSVRSHIKLRIGISEKEKIETDIQCVGNIIVIVGRKNHCGSCSIRKRRIVYILNGIRSGAVAGSNRCMEGNVSRCTDNGIVTGKYLGKRIACSR